MQEYQRYYGILRALPLLNMVYRRDVPARAVSSASRAAIVNFAAVRALSILGGACFALDKNPPAFTRSFPSESCCHSHQTHIMVTLSENNNNSEPCSSTTPQIGNDR